MNTYADDLNLALELADAADQLTMQRFEAHDLHIETKPDMTPVSDADIACEEKIRALLSTQRPLDSILGEEFGSTATASNGRQWIIDPIDGTKNFVRGVPVWATLIALLDEGKPVVGVISAPALARRWWAGKGTGAWRSFQAGPAKKLHVSGVTQLEDASVSFSSLSGWKERGLLENFQNLSDSTWRLRGFGDFLSYCLLAEGTVDIAAEPEVSLWDLAPLAILVEEAGGTFTSLANEPGPAGGDALATNGHLHQTVLQMLQKKA